MGISIWDQYCWGRGAEVSCLNIFSSARLPKNQVILPEYCKFAFLPENGHLKGENGGGGGGGGSYAYVYGVHETAVFHHTFNNFHCQLIAAALPNEAHIILQLNWNMLSFINILFQKL